MTELELKYGCNPNQKPARIFMESGELPITVLNGKPGYINFMDAFNSYQLVKELKAATDLPRRGLLQARLPPPAPPWAPPSPMWRGRSTLQRGWTSPPSPAPT